MSKKASERALAVKSESGYDEDFNLPCPFCGPGRMMLMETPNKGKLYVAEELETATECFEANIEWWECSNCGTSMYLGECED
jgi:hypothetical protein